MKIQLTVVQAGRPYICGSVDLTSERAELYNAAHPIVRQVMKKMILGILLAVGPLLQLATAQAGTCNSQKKHRRTTGWAVLYIL